MENGYIKIYRKILDNPIVCKDTDYFMVWIYLLLKATHSGYYSIFQGKKIELMPGQLITGRKKIAKACNISESKVQRILTVFESEQQIKKQSSNKNSLITVVNWKKYQTVGEQIE